MNGHWDHATTDSVSDMESVCELFAGGRNSEVFDYLCHYSESPLQVPFYYLKLVRIGKAGQDVDNPSQPSAEQVELAYRCILQRPPEDSAVVLHHVEVCNSALQLVASLLSSHEAITRMPAYYARAFPNVGRLWHVHIPKTAGSSFATAAMENNWGVVNTNILSGAAGNVLRVSRAVRHVPGPTPRVLITGHWNLTKYMDLIGPFDRVIVFVRDPLEMCISEFNYAVDVVQGNPNVHPGDPASFLARGLDPESFQRSLERGLFVPNVQCAYLSTDGTCATAMKNLTMHNAELLPAEAADEAIQRYFRVSSYRKINVSRKHVKLADLGTSLREEILIRNPHDVVLNGIAAARYREFKASGVLRVQAA